jgi:hypothetical protein
VWFLVPCVLSLLRWAVDHEDQQLPFGLADRIFLFLPGCLVLFAILVAASPVLVLIKVVLYVCPSSPSAPLLEDNLLNRNNLVTETGTFEGKSGTLKLMTLNACMFMALGPPTTPF